MNYYLKHLRTGEIEHIGLVRDDWCFALCHETFWDERLRRYAFYKIYSFGYSPMCRGRPVSVEEVRQAMFHRSMPVPPIVLHGYHTYNNLKRHPLKYRLGSAECVAHGETAYDIFKGGYFG